MPKAIARKQMGKSFRSTILTGNMASKRKITSKTFSNILKSKTDSRKEISRWTKNTALAGFFVLSYRRIYRYVIDS